LDGRYAGQPLLVTANDYENNLFNGDIGVVVQQGDDLVAAFRRGGGEPVMLPLVAHDVRPRMYDGAPGAGPVSTR
jgi:exodeoxyribonuclease V alpha subunit